MNEGLIPGGAAGSGVLILNDTARLPNENKIEYWIDYLVK